MPMGRPKAKLVSDSELREQLESLANSGSLPAGLVRRAKIILMSASGKNDREIAPQLETSRNTVGLWRRRFLAQGVSGLQRLANSLGNSLVANRAGAAIDGTSRLASVWLAATSTKTFKLSIHFL
jgi:Homeodomain-like domain